MAAKRIAVRDLMDESGVKFGTSGARGLAEDMTDEVCHAYTVGFLQHLEAGGELHGSGGVAFGGDLRPSTGRIMAAVAGAIRDKGYNPVNCGRLPSPALALYGLLENVPTAMVTGSHIPEDRNGIKYTKKAGEILKKDEAGMMEQSVTIPDGLFDERGLLAKDSATGPPQRDAVDLYLRRYLDFFPSECLAGTRIGVYQHSAVGRDLVISVLSGLGAEVTPLGPSNSFVPVDTEAIRPEDVDAARQWAEEHAFDTIVSTDGDSDRPLVSDHKGRWLRGDVAGILCAGYLGAQTVVTPVSSNSAVERCGWFKRVLRTRIGSPYVIEAMDEARGAGDGPVMGYEANGGFLLASDVRRDGRTLRALPTRDALIVHLTILLSAMEQGKGIAELVSDLPRRYTYSDRLKDYPTETSRERIAALCSGDAAKDVQAIRAVFGEHFGEVAGMDAIDGLRISFDGGDVVHLRPSGNAPEFRCYAEADTEERAAAINRVAMDIMRTWR